MTKVIYTIERTTIESADIVVEVDEQEFEAWSRRPVKEGSFDLVRHLRDDASWPDNIAPQLATAKWLPIDEDIRVDYARTSEP